MEIQQHEETSWIDRPVLFEAVLSAIGGALVAGVGFLQHRFVIGLDIVPLEFLVAPFTVGATLAALVAFFIRQSRRNLLARLNTAQSISKSHRSEKEKLEVSLQAIIETVMDGIVTIDDRGTVLTFNPAAKALFGYEADEVIGQNVKMLMPEPYRSQHDGYLENYRLTQQEKIIGKGREVVGLRKDGSTFPLELGVSKMTSGDKNLFAGVLRDISVLKEHERSLVAARDRAEVANQTKADFLANMSHELRTPLNAIIGFSHSIQSELFGAFSDKRYVEYATHINESGQHLLDIISDILDFSAIDAGKLELYDEDVEVAPLIEAAITMLRHRAENKRLKLTSDISPGCPRLNADETRVKQMMINLISNAVKFTPTNGEVIVRADVDEQGRLVVSVSDTGIGMDDGEVVEALIPFGRAEPSHADQNEGTGLGVPLTRKLAEAHGATFEIDSEKGKGTTVTIVFPQERVLHQAR